MPSREDNASYEESASYGTANYLQTYDVFIPPRDDLVKAPRYWIIYVHGGAWRDPFIDSSAFVPACKHLVASPMYEHISPYVEGYASLNYRLSSDGSQDFATTAPWDRRNAKHPDHVLDIVQAISVLQQKYAFEDRYLLVGHSCGAMMVLQTVMNIPEVVAFKLSLPVPWAVPRAILGVNGIYDLSALVERHAHIPAYRAAVTSAFGEDEAIWDAVSPATADWINAPLAWGRRGRRLLVIAHNRVDDLVEWGQAEVMEKTIVNSWGADLEKVPDNPTGQEFIGETNVRAKNYALIELRNTHDEVWENGLELASAIAFTVQGLLRLEKSRVAFQEQQRFVTS